MKVLVIGGTGVISTAIVDRLSERGHDVTVFNRGLRPIYYQKEVTVIHGDRRDVADFTAEMQQHSFDAVIDMISFDATDATVTLNAFQAQKDACHFIFTSSVAAYKRPFRRLPVKESAPLLDVNTIPYAYHKAQMEGYLHQKMADGYQITIIRPALTYGIGCKNIGVFRNNYGIITRLQAGKPVIVFGDGTTPVSFTFAPDLAKAFVGLLQRPQSFGRTYNACSEDWRSWDDLYLAFGQLIGVTPKILHLSSELLYKASSETFGHVMEEKRYPAMYDTSQLKQDLPDFQCDYSLEQTLAAIYAWYQSDAAARVVDPAKDALEDALVAQYNQFATSLTAN